MSNFVERERDLNEMILAGKALEGFEKHYAEGVVMQENSEEPRVGKAANRAYEEQFFSSLEEVHGVELRSSGAGEQVTFSEWTFDVTFQGGERKQLEQAVVRRWEGGQVVHERFYHP